MFTILHAFFSGLARSFRSLRTQIARLTPDVVEIVAGLRELLNNPTLDVVATLTPTATDNLVLVSVRGAFATLFPENAVQQGQGDVESIAKHLRRISKYSPDVRDAILAKVAALVVRERADLRKNEADLLVQMAVSADRAKHPIK